LLYEFFVAGVMLLLTTFAADDACSWMWLPRSWMYRGLWVSRGFGQTGLRSQNRWASPGLLLLKIDRRPAHAALKALGV